jgi:hypothetical protein
MSATDTLDQVVLDYVRNHMREEEPAVPTAEIKRVGIDVATTAAAVTFRPAVVRPAAQNGTTAPVMTAAAKKALARPIFQDLNRISKLPILTFPVLPPPAPKTPIQAENVWLWPDAAARTAYYMLSSPVRMELSVVIEQDASFRISGGSATVVVGLFPAARTQAAIDNWIAALRRVSIDASAWRFEPLQLNRLDAALDIPAGHTQGAISTSTSPRLGTVTFLLRLTSLGAQIWKQGLEGGSPPPGVCNLTAWYVASGGAAQIAAQQQQVNATLAALTSGVSAETAVRTMNPELAVDATLTIDGDPTIEVIGVEMRARNGSVQTQTFGAEGGTLTMRMTSSNPRAEQVDWSVRVVFAAASWPPMRVSGTLSNATGWVDLLVPSSWLRAVSLTTMLIGPDGSVLASRALNPANRVTGAVDFTAPFLEGATSLHTGFETSSQESTTVLVPRPPSQPPGTLKLTIFALRDGKDVMLVRNLNPDEEWVLVKVYANARIELLTNRSPEARRDPETAAVANAMAALTGG